MSAVTPGNRSQQKPCQEAWRLTGGKTLRRGVFGGAVQPLEVPHDGSTSRSPPPGGEEDLGTGTGYSTGDSVDNRSGQS